MKKALLLSLLFLIASCGVQKKIAKDPYVGMYDFTMFELPSMGDVDAKLFIKKEDGKYISEITPASEDQAPVEFELDSSIISASLSMIGLYFCNAFSNILSNSDSSTLLRSLCKCI